MNKNQDAAYPRPLQQLVSCFSLEELAPAIQKAADALNKFGLAYCEIARANYRAENGKLPGSDRTKRLRKKRRTKVLEWMGDSIEQFR